MNTVLIRNLEVGVGQPKIIVPIVGKTQEEIFRGMSEVVFLPSPCCGMAGGFL